LYNTVLYVTQKKKKPKQKQKPKKKKKKTKKKKKKKKHIPSRSPELQGGASQHPLLVVRVPTH
jgi:hypothetical protein